MFDMGAFETTNDEIMIFGGFNEKPLDSVYRYRGLNDGVAHGEVSLVESKLGAADFFTLNGISIKIPVECNAGKREVMV